MKNLKLFGFMGLIVFGFSFFLTSCEDNSNFENSEEQQFELKKASLDNDAVIIDKLLADLKPELINQSKRLKEFELISFEVVKNNKTNEITLENFKTSEFFPMASKEDYQQRNLGYQVDCDNGDDSWSESCNNQWSCGRLIARCLNEGGCATTCQQKSTSEVTYSSVEVTFLPLIK